MVIPSINSRAWRSAPVRCHIWLLPPYTNPPASCAAQAMRKAIEQSSMSRARSGALLRNAELEVVDDAARGRVSAFGTNCEALRAQCDRRHGVDASAFERLPFDWTIQAPMDGQRSTCSALAPSPRRAPAVKP